MSLDFEGLLKTALTGTPLTVTGGGRTETFTFVEYGRHFKQDGAFFTFRTLDNARRVSDVGGGAQQSSQRFDVHAWWPDDDTMSDPIAFRKAVVDEVETRIRAKEKILGSAGAGTAWYAEVVNDVQLDDLLRSDQNYGAVLAFHTVLTVEVNGVEVYQ